MAAVFMRCQKTGWYVPTGIYVPPGAHISAGEFYAYSRCSGCGQDHEWTDKTVRLADPELLRPEVLPFAA